MVLQFIKEIEVEGEMLAFTFNRNYTIEGVFYIVHVEDSYLVSRFFKMSLYYNSWKIVSEVPNWIMNLEKQFSNAIFRNGLL